MWKSHRYWSNLGWSLWIIVFGASAAMACVGHPVVHNTGHPPVCIDASGSVAQRDEKPILFSDGGAYVLSRLFLAPPLLPMSLSARLPLPHVLSPDQLFGMFENRPLSIPFILLVILRL